VVVEVSHPVLSRMQCLHLRKLHRTTTWTNKVQISMHSISSSQKRPLQTWAAFYPVSIGRSSQWVIKTTILFNPTWINPWSNSRQIRKSKVRRAAQVARERLD
jgi:hypothetical protein